MKINPKNDVVIKAESGLHWLGHRVTSQGSEVDSHTTKSAMNKLNLTNIASYKSLKLSEQAKTDINWQILQKMFDI